MLLALDIGNTNIVTGVFDPKGKLLHTWRISTHPLGTSDEFRVKIQTLCQLEKINYQDIRSVLVSSVVPMATSMVRPAFSEKDIKVIDHHWPFHFSIKAHPANQIGMDRLVNAHAAVELFGAPIIIVDSGTATTVCAISANKEYLGGAIMPGIELSVETLARRTAQLFSIELTVPPQVIGRNTQEALQSGIILGYASMIDGMVQRFREELQKQNPQSKVKVVATGGVSTLLKGVAQDLEFFETDLTLKGIWMLYESLSH
jgi:type III pantothenate kinase